MFKIIYLPTAEFVKISPDLKEEDISKFITEDNYCFASLGKYIIISNREPSSSYAYKSIPKYYFELIEVLDV